MNYVGLIPLILGLLMVFKPTMEFMIKASNSMRGVKTNITKLTVWTYRISGIIAILVGLLLLIPSK